MMVSLPENIEQLERVPCKIRTSGDSNNCVNGDQKLVIKW